MSFSKFYFLHIFKCSGRNFKNNILSPIQNVLKTNVLLYNGPEHANWDEFFIDDKTYIVSSFREPIERTVSHYVQEKYFLKTNKELINKYDFFFWLEENEQKIKNFQAKSIFQSCSPMNNEIVTYVDFELSEKNISLIFERLSRINLLLHSENIKSENYYFIINKIFSDLNIKTNINDFKQKESLFFNKESAQIYNELKEKEKIKLGKINSLDFDIYNMKKLYTL